MDPLDQTDAIVIANSDLKPSTKKINHISKVLTELKKIEIERTREFNEVSNILDGIGDLLFVMDKNRIITRVNKSTCQALRKKPEEIVGKRCCEVVHGSNEPWPNCPACKTFETNLSVTAEINDSNLGIPLLVTTSPIFDEKGELIQCVHIAKDMTSIKLAEEELHIAANLFDAATDSILVHDLDGKFVYFNEMSYKSRGYNREEFQSLRIRDLQAPGVINDVGSKIQSMTDKEDLTFEALNVRKDKTVFPVEVHLRVLESDGRKFVLSVARDISERKKVEADRSRLFHDMNERVKELNCIYRVSKIFEKSDIVIEDALLETVNLFPPAMQYPEAACARVVVGNQEFSTKNFEEAHWKLTADIKVRGEVVGFVEVSYLDERPTVDEGPFLKEERNLMFVVADRLGKIIERKEAEEALSASEQRWATTLCSVGDGVIATDILGKITFMNRIAENLTGWSSEEALERKFGDVFKIVNEQTKLDVEDPVAKVLESGLIVDLANYTSLVQKSGSEVPIDDSAAPIKNADGKITGAVIVFRDRSERKKVEEKLKENATKIEVMNEKLRVVGGLTRHDVRNKLAAITGYAYLLKKKYSNLADIIDRVNRIELAVKESVAIFDFAKMYEQLGVEELIYVNVEKAVDEAVGMFSGLTFEVSNRCHGLTVTADSFLRQMFYNFIDNTIKYGQKTTTIRVYYEKAASGELSLFYEDDGVGISAEDKLRLFSEGFSTGGSTGFGLFLSKKMIDVYGWKILEIGEPGKGVKFVISISATSSNGKENYQIIQ
jgi:PAS domain S-box-containing protein